MPSINLPNKSGTKKIIVNHGTSGLGNLQEQRKLPQVFKTTAAGISPKLIVSVCSCRQPFVAESPLVVDLPQKHFATVYVKGIPRFCLGPMPFYR